MENNPHYKIFDLILGCNTVQRLTTLKTTYSMGNGIVKPNDRCYRSIKFMQFKEQIGHNFRVWHNLRKLFIDEIKSR